jgi:uncharacterized protein YjiS (DUF1127 family)
MSTLTLEFSRRRRLRVFEIVADWFGGMSDGLRIARRYHELAAMSDAELTRLGLSRYDIPQAALRVID